MIIKRPRQAVLTPCGLPARMVFRAYRPPSDLLSTAKMVRLLFSNSEQGIVYDPSDLSTLFQDSAGTTPVTAVEQPVGLILDKSGRGNHAFQATTTKRPVYSRRVNFCSTTEAFDTWSASTATVDPNVAMSPIGTLTADRVNFSASTSSGVSRNLNTIAAPLAMSVWARSEAGTRTFRLWAYNATDGAVSSPDFVATTTWQKFTVTIPRTVSTSSWYIYNANSGPTAGTLLIWGASLTLATDAHLPYQWVNTATDYDADPAKFPAYLRFDGVDDGMQTNSIDFTGTDKMTVWAGITKLRDAAVAVVTELGTSLPVGGFYVAAPNSVGPTFGFASKGTIPSSPSPSGHAAPISRVVTGIGDIGADIATCRVNGVSTTFNSDQGTGNYGNYPMYIGARAGTSLLFNGRLYSLIVRGAQSSQSQIEAPELYVKRKMKLP